ncbi:magnesium transporter [Microbacterium amylolyticum]|uniref:Magnesium transporter MgtE n=1 Tax=Microbacterium amylolyticum TaxID=936337 RepID=A0ABS4ZHT3_9MICO|nr:magnesium transporter [Microbacterium amylolyticum]MBP2436840.1 magnesium transporter [Microbacterium amylolyticum]
MDDEFNELIERMDGALRERSLSSVSKVITDYDPHDVARLLEREDPRDRAIIYRLLSRNRALEVFELLEPEMRSELIQGLRDEDTAKVFEELDPDDRAQLIDELPAGVAKALMSGLSPAERALTAPMLGFDADAIGRYMSTEYVRLRGDMTLREALEHVRARGIGAETIYQLPVTSAHRRLLGVISLRRLVMGDPDDLVRTHMRDQPITLHSIDKAEDAAREIMDAQLLAAPVVDSENRLLGLVTIDDAQQILERTETRRAARQGGAEPLRRPYLASPLFGLVRSRVVWLLLLAVSALLTVQVLGAFEDKLEQVIQLALFVPLLTGTAGNTGSQAAVTLTRALAMGDVRPRDILLVMWREVRVGMMLGALLGGLGFVLASLVFGIEFGEVIGLTLIFICTLAATVGGAMPLIAQAVRADPAVFSTPFIATFCDATSLLVYFGVATWLMGL